VRYAELKLEPFRYDANESEYDFLEMEEFEYLEMEVNRNSPDYIRWIQNSLNKKLGLRLKVDGIMGSQTRRAIQIFQQKQGLMADGVVEPKTEAALIVGSAPPFISSVPGGAGIPSNTDFVRWVQTALNGTLGLRLTVDGIQGPETRSAIRKFQEKHNLPSTGIINLQTSQRLVSAFSGVRQDKSACTGLQSKEILNRFRKGQIKEESEEVRRKHFQKIGEIALCVKESQKTLTPIRTVELIGHASTEGNSDFNKRLGKMRAERTKSILKSTLNSLETGLGDQINIPTDSRGEDEPRGGAPEEDRRVEIRLPIDKQLTVEQLRITDDRFNGPLSWNQVIGLDTATLNLELIASGLPPATMPAKIRVELLSRVPNRVSGAATLSTPVELDVPRIGPDPANLNRTVYRLSRSLTSVGDFLRVERRLKEVATVVRSGGTSDAQFRRELGWNPRGIGTQPVAVGTFTGSESGEIPDAFALFRSAGVEVLELRVPAKPNWRVPSAVKRLIRNPADVMYYSGHGLSASGMLALDIENKPCGDHGTYRDWLGPTDLTVVWTSPMDLDLLILAGCSVLKIDFSTSPPSGPGLGWSRLLRAKGGPLSALMGYQRGAPCDSPNGERIARQMAQRLARGSTNFARDWLEVNGDNNANNAVAMDTRGYWWIEGTWTGGYDIKGPMLIPSGDSRAQLTNKPGRRRPAYAEQIHYEGNRVPSAANNWPRPI
jgi:outer membrane protein OmpA-like peptidoglycan-associated protein